MSSLLWLGFFTWCHRAKHISFSTRAAYGFDVTSGGGTAGSWWTGLIRVCGVNEQLVAEQHQEYCGSRSSTSISTMTEAQMRADMEALMARLVQTERALMDSTTSRSCAEDHSTTRRHSNDWQSYHIHTFIGEHKDWPEWSFQFTAYMGSANPKSIEALRWAAMEEDKITAAAVVKQSFEEHNPQLYLALAMLCKGSALVTVKSTEVSHGLEAWRELNAPSRSCRRLKQSRDGNVT